MPRGTGGAGGPAEPLGDLEAMLDAIVDYAIIRLDVSGNVESWRAGAESLTGYSEQEVIGRPVAVLYSDQDRDDGFVQREMRAAAETGRFDTEARRVRKDGSTFWAAITVAPIRDSRDVLTGYVKVIRDITERREAEMMFRSLLESAPDATIVAGPDGRIVLVNRQTEELFGYTRDELIGQEVEVLVPQRFRQRHPEYRSGFFAQPRARPMGVGLDLVAMRRDGSVFPVEISLSPIQTERGTVVSAAVRDVTERHKQMTQLRRQRDEIMELSTPVVQIWDKVLALPIIGTLDSGRAARLTESLLDSIRDHQAEVVILDISGVPAIDTLVAQHLLKTVQAATLMGAVSIMSGVRPETAQAMVHLGIDLGQLRSRSTLRDALQLALQVLRSRELGDDTAGRDPRPGDDRGSDA